MPERPKQEKKGTVAEDQKERGYYYDDAHGYEEYEDDDDEAEEDEDPETGDGRQETRDRRQETGDKRRETRDGVAQGEYSVLAPKVRRNLARANGPGKVANGESRNAAK